MKKDEKGQNIIESKEETEARKIRVAKKLEKYRTSNALNMSKEEEEKVREALKDANEFLQRRECSERYCRFRAIPTGHQRAIGVRRTGYILLRDVFR